MGQQEVYDFLKKNQRKWFNSENISTKLKVSIGSVTNCLKKLRNTGTINFKEAGARNRYLYKYKR